MKEIALPEIVRFLNETLKLSRFSEDPSNNGLQVEGQEMIRKVAFAVDAVQATIEAAIAAEAQLLVVHHGLSWRSEPRRFTGIAGNRLRRCFVSGLSVYAAHLPLDAHPVYGNNAELCRILQLEHRQPFFEFAGEYLGCYGDLAQAVPPEKLLAPFGKYQFCPAAAGPETVRTVAVISGAGGVSALEEAQHLHADLLVTGELEHTMFHLCREGATHVAALGHYASEVYGVQQLQVLLRRQFGVEGTFLDFPTNL